jgi:hypothetical protein
MSKTPNEKIEILRRVTDLVHARENLELWRNIAKLAQSQEYKQCEDFSARINLHLDVIEKKMPERAEELKMIRSKLVELRGTEVFSNIELLQNWLNKPNKAFGNKTPLSLMETA